MIYFDNAATTWQKPEKVYDRVDDVLRNKSGNPSRGSHKISLEASRIIFKTRSKLAEFFNAEDSSQIAFTKNATEGTNLIFKGLLKKGDEVIISSLEHNAVFRPLNRLEEEGIIDLNIVDTEQGSKEFLTSVEEAVTPETKLIAVTHASNVTGNILPIRRLGEIAEAEGVYFLVDAAQTAGVLPIDVVKDNIDFLTFTGHKALFGPQGVGGLYFNPEAEFTPLLEGGTGGDSKSNLNPDIMPDKYEAGTLNTPAIAGLGAGLEFIEEEGLEKIRQHESELVSKLEVGLDKLEGIEILTSQISSERVGVTSFRAEEVNPAEMGQLLDRNYDIAVRTGIHCAPLAHKSIGSYDTETVRVSFSYFNKLPEVDRFLTALKEIISS